MVKLFHSFEFGISVATKKEVSSLPSAGRMSPFGPPLSMLSLGSGVGPQAYLQFISHSEEDKISSDLSLLFSHSTFHILEAFSGSAGINFLSELK
jgi:hypothetical protein